MTRARMATTKMWLIVGLLMACLTVASVAAQETKLAELPRNPTKAEDQYERGRRLEHGLGMKANPKKALDWYEKAAEKGKKPSPVQIKELRTELEKMMEDDQKLRTRAAEVEEKYGHNSEELAALWKEQKELDNRLLKRLEEIIRQYGWPGTSLVGANASLAAFLIIQHADYEYQKKYFPLISEAVKKGEIAPGHVALLEDRILMREGKKQIYGSQLRRNDTTGQYEMWLVEDEENLDKRRASVGLEPIAAYLKRFGVTYIPPKKR